MIDSKKVIICTFCGKTEGDVELIVLKEHVDDSPAICSECVEVCRNVIGAARLGYYKLLKPPTE